MIFIYPLTKLSTYPIATTHLPHRNDPIANFPAVHLLSASEWIASFIYNHKDDNDQGRHISSCRSAPNAGLR